MDEFFRALAPHLAANLLTVAFVYGFMQFSKIEKDDPHGHRGLPELGAILMVVGFLAYGLWLSNS